MTKPGPGKFERNESFEESEYLYNVAMTQGGEEDSFGDASEGIGWFALIFRLEDEEILTHPAYIVEETDQGFFDYLSYSSTEHAQDAFNKMRDAYLSAELEDEDA